MPPSLEFRPRIALAMRGYNRDRLLRDVGAGVTVGIVALPLAMAFAIASGLTPQAGLWTAIIAGLLIALLGGSNVQIGGPAGAFIVIVYGILERYGLANLMIATSFAGVLLFVLGFLKLGRLVRYVPVSIVIGFTNGIAVLIAMSQVKELLGLKVDKMPADFFTQVKVVATHIDTFNPHAFALGTACFIGLFLWPRLSAAHMPLKTAMTLPGMHATLVELVKREGAMIVFSLYGSLFFGAVAKIDEIVEAVESGPDQPVVVLDASRLVHLDTSGLDSLRQLHKAVLGRKGTLFIENLHEQPQEVIERAGFGRELAHNKSSAEVAF